MFRMSSTSVVVDCDETLIGKVCPAVGKFVDNELETTFVGVFEGIDVNGVVVVAVDNVVGKEVVLGCKVGDGVVSDGDWDGLGDEEVVVGSLDGSKVVFGLDGGASVRIPIGSAVVSVGDIVGFGLCDVDVGNAVMSGADVG